MSGKEVIVVSETANMSDERVFSYFWERGALVAVNFLSIKYKLLGLEGGNCCQKYQTRYQFLFFSMRKTNRN